MGGRLAAAARAVAEALERRTLLAGTPTVEAGVIAGVAWEDVNGDRTRQVAEPLMAGWTVYLDKNRNAKRDAGEAFVLTGLDGAYRFEGLAPGRHFVAVELPTGWERTTPTANGAVTTPIPTQAGLGRVPPRTMFTGSDAPVYPSGEVGPVEAVPVPADAQVDSLIRLTDLRNDPRFAGNDGSGFSVAVLDTGIDLDHPAFGPDADGNGIADRIVYQYDFADNDADASDVNGHGTHVTGTAAGQGDLTSGVASGAGIVALKVFPNSGTATFAAIERALQWVVENAAARNIAAVNMSIGDMANHTSPLTAYGLSDELAALAAMNVIVVSAAGNEFATFNGQQGLAYPAADPNSLAVGGVYDASIGLVGYFGATDYTTGPDRVMSISQRSTTMTDMMAPGGGITSAILGGGTGVKHGTSMAAPHVAGAATLAQQMAMTQLGRRLTPAEFRQIVRDNAATINDGDDEDDSVANTGADFLRLDVFKLQQAIYEMGNVARYAWTVDLPADSGFAGIDFGSRRLPNMPDVPDLLPLSDTGISTTDNLTNVDNRSSRRLSFEVRSTIPGSTVLLYANGVQVGSAAAAVVGTTTVVTTNAGPQLLNGSHEFIAKQIVPGLPISAASAALTVLIDTVAPAQPAAPVLSPASDTGSSETDRVTADSTPTFNLMVEQGSYFRVLVNGSYVAAGYEVGTTYTTRFVSDGIRQFQVQAVDTAGNTSTSSAVTQVTIDTMANPAPPSVVDSSFAQNGFARSSFDGREVARGSLVQPDGKYVIAGYTFNDSTQASLSLVRFLPDGQPDPSFGNGGRVDAQRFYNDEFHAIAIQSSGKILAAGLAGEFIGGSSYSSRFLIERFNTDGTLDTTFGPNGTGRVFNPFPTTHYSVEGIVTRPDGRIVALTRANAGSGGFDYGLVGLLPDGTIDSTFGTDGRLSWNVGATEIPVALAATSDGGFIVLGTTIVSSTVSVFVSRHLPDGRRDTAFGDNGTGVRVMRVGVAQTYANALAIQPDGRIVFGGRAYSINGGTQMDGYVARLLPDGRDDPSFGTGGTTAVINPVTSVTLMQFGLSSFIDVEGVAITADGRIAVAGTTGNAVLARLRSDGRPDTAFAPGGFFVSTKQKGSNGSGVHPMPDGRLVYVGAFNFNLSEPFYGLDFGMFRSQLPLRGPLAPVMSAASDSGTLDGITDRDSLTFGSSGGMPSPYWRVYRDGELLIGGYQIGTSFTDSNVPEGRHQYAFTSVDYAGNESEVGESVSVLVDRAGPVAAFDRVLPNPTGKSVDSVTLRFDEMAVQLAINDFTLTRNGGPNLLTAYQLIETADLRVYLIKNLAALTSEPGTYVLTLAAGGATDERGRPGTSAVATWEQLLATYAADAGGPYAVVEGGQVSLAGSTVGSVGAAVAAYEWDLEYDGLSFSVDATGATASFSAAGLDGLSARSVAARVRDEWGRTGAVGTAVVAITNAAPTASFAAGPAVTLGTASTVAFTNASDPSPADVAAGFLYSYDFNADGDFDDAGDIRDSASPSAAFAFSAAGTYAISGRIADKDGGYIDYTKTLTVNPVPVPPLPVVTSMKFNFQPAAAPVVSGYLIDAGDTFGLRNGKSYGWSVNHADVVVDRNRNTNQLLDTNVGVKAGGKWELAVPNGTYTVKIGVGDALLSSKNNIYVEGNLLFNYQALAANAFGNKTLSVKVSDGRLTVGVGSAAAGTTRIDFIEVTPPAAPPTSPPPTSPPPTSPPPTSPPPTSPPPTTAGTKINFQPAAAPTVSGYLVDAGATYAARNGKMYGWATSHADVVVDRNKNTNQLLDTNLAVKAGGKWELAVPNGTYTVKLGVGDAGAASTNNVWVEGKQLFNYQSLATNVFGNKSIVVTVADGKLTLGFGSIGSGLTKLDFIEVAAT